MKNIAVFTHNDLDALGSMLNINYKFPMVWTEYFHTSYRDIVEKSRDVEDYLKHNDVNLLIIVDVSFSGNKQALQHIINAKGTTKILYIDHHSYPENFFTGLDMTVIHDTKKSATLLINEYFNIPELSQLSNLINIYDIWLEEDKTFKLSMDLNEYFWHNIKDMSIQQLMLTIANNNYKLPNYNKIQNYIQEQISKNKVYLDNKKLIWCDNFTTIVFADKYFNYLLYDSFKANMAVFIVAHSYGIIRIRFNKNQLTDEQCRSIKDELGYTDIGHLRAFPIKVDMPTFEKMVKTIETINNILIKYK